MMNRSIDQWGAQKKMPTLYPLSERTFATQTMLKPSEILHFGYTNSMKVMRNFILLFSKSETFIFMRRISSQFVYRFIYCFFFLSCSLFCQPKRNSVTKIHWLFNFYFIYIFFVVVVGFRLFLVDTDKWINALLVLRFFELVWMWCDVAHHF